MGCKYACVCGANCLSCSQYEPEQYFGHAEDVLAQSKGFSSDDEWRYYEQMRREEEESYAQKEAEYYERLYEEDCPKQNELFTDKTTIE